mmetsp:Transcript_5625/g.13286  ORF Transcript_5625/g.13286 Transcript_5625/m.13286 type:complete len:375 (-) Transcript_5625:64-1188(-)
MDFKSLQLTPVTTTEPFDSQAFSVRFNADHNFLAAAGGHGTVSVFNVSTGQEAYRLNRPGHHAIKQVCWRPETAASSLRTRGVLVGAGTDGKIRQWHVTSGKCLQDVHVGDEAEQLLCVDYSKDGSKIAAGGLKAIFVLDEETKKQTACLQGGDYENTPGHANRVLACRFLPVADMPWGLVSGGWDNTVQYWDLRAGHAVRAIFGPHICGDALDVSADGTQLLTGSCRDENQLELWDIAKGERIKALPWRARGMEEPACFLYTARFSKDPHSSLICAGGSFASAEDGGEAKVFHYGGAAPHAPNKCLGTVVHYTCLSADFGAPETGLLAMGGTDGRVRIMSLKPDNASKPSTATAGYRSQHSDLTSGSEVLGGS